MTKVKILNHKSHLGRHGKTYRLASNACVIFFIVWVKYVRNSTLFFAKVSFVAILRFFW